MLIILGGLPGSGKTTVAQALARRIKACWLRLDTIENAIRSSAPLAEGQDVGPAGYVALYGLAADNLRLGQTVIADSVNPIPITRQAFQSVAAETGSHYLEIEIVCSDAATHRHRLEARPSEGEGLSRVTWAHVQDRHFEPWHPHLRLDTFKLSVEESVAEIVKHL